MAVFDSPEINEAVEAQIYDALLHGIQLDVITKKGSKKPEKEY